MGYYSVELDTSLCHYLCCFTLGIFSVVISRSPISFCSSISSRYSEFCCVWQKMRQSCFKRSFVTHKLNDVPTRCSNVDFCASQATWKLMCWQCFTGYLLPGSLFSYVAALSIVHSPFSNITTLKIVFYLRQHVVISLFQYAHIRNFHACIKTHSCVTSLFPNWLIFVKTQPTLSKKEIKPWKTQMKQKALTTNTPALKKGKIDEYLRIGSPVSLLHWEYTVHHFMKIRDLICWTQQQFAIRVYNPKTKCMSFGLKYSADYAHVELPLITAGPQTRLLHGSNMLLRKTKKCNPKNSREICRHRKTFD